MLEVVAASPAHHVGCTPYGLEKVILKPCSNPTKGKTFKKNRKVQVSQKSLGLLCCIFVAKVMANLVFFLIVFHPLGQGKPCQTKHCIRITLLHLFWFWIVFHPFGQGKPCQKKQTLH